MLETTVLRFRTAVGGFHKGDVTKYIADTAAKHKVQISELEQENEKLRKELLEATSALESLRLELDSHDTAATQESPETTQEEAEEDTPDPIAALELAAYRRAEHVERTANHRAKQVYQELDRIGQESQTSLDATQSATEEMLKQLTEYLTHLQVPYHQLMEQLNSAKARLVALGDMNPDPAENLEDHYE